MPTFRENARGQVQDAGADAVPAVAVGAEGVDEVRGQRRQEQVGQLVGVGARVGLVEQDRQVAVPEPVAPDAVACAGDRGP